MVLSSTIGAALQRHAQSIENALRATIARALISSEVPSLNAYYGQMQYHLGWVDASLHPTQSNPGKLLRPSLLLLAYEAAGAWGLAADATGKDETGYLQRALPAAVAVELTHNFSLIHDDIEDGDTERRHRSTLWKVWGVPQAINTGDGMLALSRRALWDVLEHGVESDLAIQLAPLLDRAVQVLAEGQYLDISFETQQAQEISVALYLDMIRRKTATLMETAAEMGARLGTRDAETISSLRHVGRMLGIAFQVRDDMLGVWASSAELGKTPAGDIYRRKKSLPILHTLEHANEHDQQTLREIYSGQAINDSQVDTVLAIFERTETRAYCRSFLQQQCTQAHTALARVPRTSSPIADRALQDIEAMVQFVEETAR